MTEHECLVQEIQTLSEQGQLIMSLQCEHGLSFIEIATVMKLTFPSVIELARDAITELTLGMHKAGFWL